MEHRNAHFFEVQLPEALEGHTPAPHMAWTYVFEIDGEHGGIWTLSLASDPPRCFAGEAPSADTRLRLRDSDLTEVLEGPTSLEDLFIEQRMEVSGNLDAAAVLPEILETLLGGGGPTGLSALLHPMAPAEFLATHWPDTLWVQHGGADILRLDEIPELASVHALLEAWRGVVRVFGPTDDHLVSPQVDTRSAAQLYRQGFTLVFSAVDLQLPRLRAHLAALTTDLHLPNNTWGRCMVYANPSGGALRPHFDENANFVMQLHGLKHWQIAPNAHVLHPTVSHLLGLDPPHPELQTQLESPLPDRLPDDTQTLTLWAGSRLFLPRGSWHATVAAEPSMSLNFTFSQPSWADVLCEGLRNQLITNPQWRELATLDRPERLHQLVEHQRPDLAQIDLPRLLADLLPRTPDEIDQLDLQRDWPSTLARLGSKGTDPA